MNNGNELNDLANNEVMCNKVVDIINEIREKRGLSKIKKSSKLTKTAEEHAKDLKRNQNNPNLKLHSWYNLHPCNFDGNFNCMWEKPRQVANYPSNGYEISFSGLNDANSIVQTWLNSPPHASVILNQDSFSGAKWNAIGSASVSPFTVVWFGTEPDA
ncbi:hypothetical protein K502DRAFT_353816 [Neoconidiobolus thromboides FSU 785]|nr:hypothetical protein K502DRAFT_353816 [Neoconidiobolus thromboides FSU 785]